MTDPIGTSFQSQTYGYEQQYAFVPSQSADYNARVTDTGDGGKIYHMVHVPNDAYGQQFQYIITITDPATNAVNITEAFQSGSNSYSGQIISHSAGAFVVNAYSGNTSVEWLFTNSPSDDGYFTVYPNDSAQAGTFAPACYVAGSRILTTRGEIAVEDLRPGDAAITHDGAVRPIVWIGHRAIDTARIAVSGDHRPVRIRANAFGENLPHRDLRLSPDHSVFVDGALITVSSLVNGGSIVREDHATLTYYHVELDEHAVLLAEGFPAESYLDTGNRAAFSNGGVSPSLHPDFSRQLWDAGACAPKVEFGPALDALRQRLIVRAQEMGLLHLTGDAAPIVSVDGVEIAPTWGEDGRPIFRIPAGAGRNVRLKSRSAAPVQTCGTGDGRLLGLCVDRLDLRDGDIELTIASHSALLESGFHERESDGPACWRWTDGDALLPAALLAAFPNGCELVVKLTWGMTYALDDMGAEGARLAVA